ncbi:hypothetical protein SSX86_032907 [Deinandra increscens subsp. villosa]|uniref:F-box domain-containing protein n=1 Tax=Deinandra increscens subsp. villosa TaxID=3103831 RepID=A0AAP0C305_9ASTR
MRIKTLEEIPFEMKIEILKRLPVKCLIRFRSVSKAWKALIDSSDFISHYSTQKTLKQHLIVSEDHLDFDYFVSYADDDTFPQQRVALDNPRLLNWLKDCDIVGCSHGLLFLYGDYRFGRGGHKSLTTMAVLWNPSIRKTVAVIVSNLRNKMYETNVGFGVCRETNDAKIVKVAYVGSEIESETEMDSISCVPWQVEVFALSTGAWRSPYGNLPRKSVRFDLHHETVDGFIYWLVTDKITIDGEYRSYDLIISFDITNEEFKEVYLPDSLAFAAHIDHFTYISVLRNSLVVLECEKNVNDPVVVIWKMEGGVFTKLFTVNLNSQDASIIGFRKSGAPIIEFFIEEDDWRQLVVYEPTSKDVGKFWSHHSSSRVSVYPYMETLLLLDQPDLMVYNDISMWRAKNKRLLKHSN